MRRNLKFADSEITFLRELTKQGVPFLIVGQSSAVLQGAPVGTQDVDLWFKDLSHPGILKALKKVGGTYVPPWPSTQTPPMFAREAVELFDIVTHMPGLETFDKEAKKALEIPLGGFKVKVLPLERIIVSKRATNRKKDRLALPILKDALIALKADKK